MGYVGTAPLSGDYRKLDDISGSFNGSTTEFDLEVGSVAVTPPRETTMLISVGGILQEPVSAYTVASDKITFTAAPASGADFFGILLGDTMAIGTPSDGTITAAKLASTFLTGISATTTVADADLILIDDAAGGTFRKMTRAHFIESTALDSIDIDGGAIDGTVIGANSAAAGTFAAIVGTTGTFSTSIDVTGSAGVILENDETITNSTDGEVAINGTVVVGTGSATGTLKSSGNYDLTLSTGNSTTGTITITDGSNGDIAIAPNGSGSAKVGSAIIKTAGTETIYVPATSMVVSVNAPSAGLASIDSGDVNTTIPVLDFDGGSSDEVATFNIAFPKSWNAGTITARFFWTNSNANAGNVVWGLQGICVANDGALNGAMTDAGEVIQDANITTAGDVMVTSSTPAVTINGAADDGVTFFNVFRDASDTTNDTYASDARLIGVQIFFTTDAANDA